MRKLRGITLVEVIMALCVLGIVVPASLGALGGVLTAGLKISERAYMASASERWFGKLGPKPGMAAINAAPAADENGKVRFEWETDKLPYGAVRVTLRVYGRLPGSVFTLSRIF